MSNTFAQLINDLAKAVGLPQPETEENVFSFRVDNQFVVNVGYDEVIDTLLLMAFFQPIEPEQQSELYQQMLYANYAFAETAGLTFSLAPDTNTICLGYQRKLTGLDLPELQALLKQFLDNCKQWLVRLDALAKKPQSTTPTLQHNFTSAIRV